jgi:hypothetical protein
MFYGQKCGNPKKQKILKIHFFVIARIKHEGLFVAIFTVGEFKDDIVSEHIFILSEVNILFFLLRKLVLAKLAMDIKKIEAILTIYFMSLL